MVISQGLPYYPGDIRLRRMVVAKFNELKNTSKVLLELLDNQPSIRPLTATYFIVISICTYCPGNPRAFAHIPSQTPAVSRPRRPVYPRVDNYGLF